VGGQAGVEEEEEEEEEVDASVTDPVATLLETLELEPLGADRFVVPNPDRGYGERVYGGQVAAQALRAAQHTVGAERRVHSLHGYFLLGGRPGRPIEYAVQRWRDGRSFTTRGVVARQGDEVIFTMTASFHVDEPGPTYALPLPAGLPGPDEAPTELLFIPEERRPMLPFELRELGAGEPDEHGFVPSTRRVWMRIRPGVPDEPALHACLLTWLSDLGAVYMARAPLPTLPVERLMGASLDHAMWFHRPLRADEWFLYDGHAVANGGARGLMRATMHALDGTLGVSVAQEALLRVIGGAAG